MPFYTGKTADGSDMEEVGGMFVSPDGKEWSNTPYTQEQYLQAKEERRLNRIYKEILEHINGKRTLQDEYNLIKNKQSGMSARCKKFLVDLIENFKTEEDETQGTTSTS